MIWERLKFQTFQVWFKIFMIHSRHSAKGGEAAVHTTKSKLDDKIQWSRSTVEYSKSKLGMYEQLLKW